MHQLGQWLWEGIVAEQDIDKAFGLISRSAQMEYSYAMESLGAMYLVGAGCDRNFETALYWYKRSKETSQYCYAFWPSAIGKVSLGAYEFVSEFSVEINGASFEASNEFLERLNLRRHELRARLIDKQLAMIEATPKFWGKIMNRWSLPFQGAISGCSLIFSGNEIIDQIGWSDGWNDVIWIEMSELSGAGSPCSYGELRSFSVNNSGDKVNLDNAVCDAIRDAYIGRNSSAPADSQPELAAVDDSKSGPIELHLTSTSVSFEAKLVYRGGHELFSHFVC